MMSRNEAHISDVELLQRADGELSRFREAHVDAHLAACWTCRSRSLAIEQTIASFVSASKYEMDSRLPAVEGPRALLRTRLADAAAANAMSTTDRIRQFVFSRRFPVYGSVALVGVVLGLVVHFSVRNAGAASVPDSRLTPGATRPVTKDGICSARSADGFYPIPSALAGRVFEKYRIRNPQPRAYEVDYLITPALGGADDIRNLWPQPYSDGEWNAHVKDALEEYLYGLVCDGTLDLATAQRDIATDWIAAYRKYFATTRPLMAHADFSLDPPWEN